MTPRELRTARAALGMTQTQLAAELRVTSRTVQKWEAGDVRIPHAVSRLLRREWVESVYENPHADLDSHDADSA